MVHITSLIPGFREQIKDAIKNGNLIPLLPRHHAYLEVKTGNGPRFAKIFKETWKRIPLWGRRCLLGYWKTGIARGYILSPIVELGSDGLGGRRTFAMADYYGHRYRFRSKFVDKMPDDVVQDLIAHELSHGVQSAIGIHCIQKFSDGRAEYACKDGSYFGGKGEIEEDADERMDIWGFDSESIDRWSLSAGISKVVECHNLADAHAKISRSVDRYGR